MLKRLAARRRSLGLTVAALLVVGIATACEPSDPTVTTDPGLYPSLFQANVIDYVNRCDPNSPTDVQVNAPSGTTVSVDGQPAQSGSFTTQVDQAVGDRFPIRVNTNGATRTHHVRCLPTDFPTWTAERLAQPQSQYYSTVVPLSFSPAGNYGIVFDTNGVPVWWTRDRIQTTLFNLLPNRHFALVKFAGDPPRFQELGLDGTVLREIANSGGQPTDFHDVILLPNGNYVLATAQEETADLTSWGGVFTASEDVVNHVFEILTPDGQVVWSWNAAEHIPVTETTETWRDEPEPITGLRDPWHYNSVEWTGDGFIISFRHLDAIYKVDYPSGEISWKLGGTPRAGDSLTVLDDPVVDGGGTISGQHDARLLPDGTVTLFDNGSQKGRPPRAVRFELDLTARTATLVETITDSSAPASFCCGSTRKLPGGNWVTGWGGTPHLTEQRPNGTRVFRIQSSSGVYRGIPIPFGVLSPSALRAGMDEQYG